jgi:hypothetical protein
MLSIAVDNLIEDFKQHLRDLLTSSPQLAQRVLMSTAQSILNSYLHYYEERAGEFNNPPRSLEKQRTINQFLTAFEKLFDNDLIPEQDLLASSLHDEFLDKPNGLISSYFNVIKQLRWPNAELIHALLLCTTRGRQQLVLYVQSTNPEIRLPSLSTSLIEDLNAPFTTIYWKNNHFYKVQFMETEPIRLIHLVSAEQYAEILQHSVDTLPTSPSSDMGFEIIDIDPTEEHPRRDSMSSISLFHKTSREDSGQAPSGCLIM